MIKPYLILGAAAVIGAAIALGRPCSHPEIPKPYLKIQDNRKLKEKRLEKPIYQSKPKSNLEEILGPSRKILSSNHVRNFYYTNS